MTWRAAPGVLAFASSVAFAFSASAAGPASTECFFEKAAPRETVTTRAGVPIALVGSQVRFGDRLVNRCNSLPDGHPVAVTPFRDGVAIAFRDGDLYAATPKDDGVAFEKLAAADVRGDAARALDAGRRALVAHGPISVEGAPKSPPRDTAGALPSQHVTALAVHAERLVVGTFDRGLFTLDAAGEPHEIVGAPRHVNALLSTRAGLFIGTTRGLFVASALGGSPPARVALDIPDPHVNGMAEGRDGTVWLATSSGLVGVRIGDGSPRVLGVRDGLPSPLVYAVTEAADGALWVGTAHGVARLRKGEATVIFGVENGKLPHDWITALLADGNGVFAGTYNAGVVRLDPDGSAHAESRFRGAWINPNGLARLPGSLGVVASTLGGGLVARDPSQASGTPLPDDDVTAAVIFEGAMWIGTRAGIARRPL